MALRINEIRVDQPSTDNDEYFELFGDPGDSLDGLTYIVIGDGPGGSGVIEAVVDLTGQSLDADGFFVAAEGTFALGTADLVATLDFENGDSVTHLLVSGFTGANGDDLDTDDNGTLDVTPWTNVIDSVALRALDGNLTYSATTVGPEGTFLPAHVFRDPDGTGDFQIGQFSPVGGNDTPGAENAGAPPPSTDIVINEIDADTTGTDTAEFVELYDGGGGNTALDGLTLVLFNGSDNLSYDAFDLDGFTTDSNGYFVLGNASVGPDIVFGSNGLQNGADAVALVVGDATNFPNDTPMTGLNLIDAIVYDTNDADDPELLGGLGQMTQFNEDELGDKDTDSIGRDPNGTGAFATLDTPTPGAANGSAPPPPAQVVTIMEIQGADHRSPLEGQAVKTSGIVTAVDSNGFYLQDAGGDSNIATSDAIFVFTGSNSGVSVGDGLTVTGSVSEFFPGGVGTRNLSTTQLGSVTEVLTDSTGNALPGATIIGQGGRVPPSENIDDDAFGSFDPAMDGIDFFESLEGMLVTATDLVAVSGTSRFGEIFAVADNGADATGFSDRGTLNISPDDFNPEKIQIDEDKGILPGFDLPDVDVGALLGSVTGVIGYGFGNFEIYPTEVFVATLPDGKALPPEVTTLVGTDEQLTVATYNVLNLDPNEFDGDTDIANLRFDAIADQIVGNLNAPDIIGLQEIQDNTGSTDDGVTSASETLQLLAEAIVLAGGPAYSVIDNPFIGDNTSGGQPGANIRTAFLYNPDRVDLVDGSVQTIGSQAPGGAFAGARLPLAATFLFNFQEVTVVNNHFSSKGGSAPILGIEQPFDQLQEDTNVNGSLDERQAQSEAVQGFVEDILGADAAANVVVLGDLNEFEFISPVTGLESAGLTNLVNSIAADERYSFIFQGNSQELDHILISDALGGGTGVVTLTGSAEFDIVHVNSEFVETPFRASDHDPGVARLALAPADDAIVGDDGNNRLKGTNGDDIILGRDGNDRLSGKDGDDRLSGGDGRDKLSGGDGNDVLLGGDGKDSLDGGRGDDGMSGGDGKDRMDGGRGIDIMRGGADDDRLKGGSGNDELFGDGGNDRLDGGSGDDKLEGGTGDDVVSGGSGGDTFVFGIGDGNDVFRDFDLRDDDDDDDDDDEGGGLSFDAIDLTAFEIDGFDDVAALITEGDDDDDAVIDFGDIGYNNTSITLIGVDAEDLLMQSDLFIL